MEPTPPNTPPPSASKQPTPSESAGDSIPMLKRQLYAREESAELKKRMDQLQKPKTPRVRRDELKPEDGHEFVDQIRQKVARRRQVTKWVGIAGGIFLLFVGALAGTLWYRSTRQVSEKDIQLAITAPDALTAGEAITYTVTYKNTSNVDWSNVEITFDPPGGFRFFESQPSMQPTGRQYLLSVGDLVAGEEGAIEVRGQLVGELNATALGRFEAAISPANTPQLRFRNSQTFTTTLVAVPLTISVNAAADPADGENVPVAITVRNTSSLPLEGVLLRVTPTDGAKLVTEDVRFTEGFSVLDAWWELPTLQPLDELTRTAVMHIDGAPGERRIVVVEGLIRHDKELFVQREIDHVMTVSAADVTVAQTFNGQPGDQVVNTGQDINAVVNYQNTGTTGLTNVVVSVKLDGAAFDPSSLKLRSGSYDPNTKTISWTAASVPELGTLQPQQAGTIEYQFSLLPYESFPTDGDAKNQTLIATAIVNSPGLTRADEEKTRELSDRVVLSVNTDALLEADAFYDDGRLGLASSGPVPPKVGEETTYTVRFRLGSSLNDLGDVKLRAVLPDGVRYTGNVYKTTGEVEYNERTGEVFWNIPLIEGLAGRTSPAPELHVQVAITPGENLRGKHVPLLQSVNAEGLDIFTDQTITASVERLPTTETASPQNGQVE